MVAVIAACYLALAVVGLLMFRGVHMARRAKEIAPEVRAEASERYRLAKDRLVIQRRTIDPALTADPTEPESLSPGSAASRRRLLVLAVAALAAVVMLRSSRGARETGMRFS